MGLDGAQQGPQETRVPIEAAAQSALFEIRGITMKALAEQGLELAS